MQFETQRLIIRPWQPNQDARHAMDIYGDPQVTSWVDDGGRDTSIWQVQKRLQRYRDHSVCGHQRVGSWAVEQKSIGRVIGHIMLMPLPDIKMSQTQRVQSSYDALIDTEGLPIHYIEIGWYFRPSSWGIGYASEAAARVAKFAFEGLNLTMLLAITPPENKRSVALMERLGTQYDGLTVRCYQGKPLLLYKFLPAEAMPVEAGASGDDTSRGDAPKKTDQRS